MDWNWESLFRYLSFIRRLCEAHRERGQQATGRLNVPEIVVWEYG